MSDKIDNKLIMYGNKNDEVRFRNMSSAEVGELWFGSFYLWRIQEENGGVAYEFQTSLEPPMKWLVGISKKFPKVMFKLEFDAVGMCEGVAYVRNGKISTCKDQDVF